MKSFKKIDHVDRLRQVVIRARIEYLPYSVLSRVRTDHKNRGRRQHRVMANAAEQRASGHVRQMQVQEDKVRLVLSSEVPAEIPLHRRQQLELREVQEKLLNQSNVVEVVLDVQDFSLSRRIVPEDDFVMRRGSLNP